MENNWKVILLLLAVIISTSKAETTEELSSSAPESTESPTHSSAAEITTIPSPAPTLSTVTASSATATLSDATTTLNVTASLTATTPPAGTTSSATATASATATTSATTTASATATTSATATSLSTTTPSAKTIPTVSTSPSTINTEETTLESTVSSNPNTASTISSITPSTGTSSSTTAAASGSTVTPTTSSTGFLISETNLLLTNDFSKYFIEIQVESKHQSNFWLVIHNASMDSTKGPLQKYEIPITPLIYKWYVYANETALSEKMQDVDSVLIALYDNEESANNLTTQGLYDILLYSSSGHIHPGLKEQFSKILNESLIIDYEKFNISEPVSLSRCSNTGLANNVAVLTNETKYDNNACSLNFRSLLEMKLTRNIQLCTPNSPNDFESALKQSVISNLNREAQCGLAACMLTEVSVIPRCINKCKELDVNVTVNSAFPDQINLIMNGYINFLHQAELTINEEHYNLNNSNMNCFDGTTLPTSTDDDRVRVTVAVVVSCIGVFLLILLFVVLYLRRKRKGILQFHMTRLDEDEDLAGDMDDFVGNQGPTFRSYR